MENAKSTFKSIKNVFENIFKMFLVLSNAFLKSYADRTVRFVLTQFLPNFTNIDIRSKDVIER